MCVTPPVSHSRTGPIPCDFARKLEERKAESDLCFALQGHDIIMEGYNALRGSIVVTTTNPMFVSVDLSQEPIIKKRNSIFACALQTARRAIVKMRPNTTRPQLKWRDMLLALQTVGATKTGTSSTAMYNEGRQSWIEDLELLFEDAADLRTSIIVEANPYLRRRHTFLTVGPVFDMLSKCNSSIRRCRGSHSLERIRGRSCCRPKESGTLAGRGFRGKASSTNVRVSTRVLRPLFGPGNSFHMRSDHTKGIERGSIPFGQI